MTKRAKRFCKKVMGEGVSRNAARLMLELSQCVEDGKWTKRIAKTYRARWYTLTLEERFLCTEIYKEMSKEKARRLMGDLETGEDDG